MTDIHLGFTVGSGEPVAIPLRHLAVVGQTSESGKTTTLEGLVSRLEPGTAALTFITKRGESAFQGGDSLGVRWQVQPYFRDRADWQFVDGLLAAQLQEKNKFLRPWIMKICRTTRTLAEVHRKVKEALRTAKGIHEGVYTQLDAYLDLIVPEIQRAKLADTLDIQPGVNVMDVSGFATPMQMLFIQSALDVVNEHCSETIVVIPEAWEMVPEGKGSPVKASAVTLVRKGAAIGNRIWVDSQDMAGVDKVILRGCTVWLIGVQREANEIKRNLANVPHGVAKPSAKDVALLERGQFYACWGTHCIKTYVQPAWMDAETAQAVARGEKKFIARVKARLTRETMDRVSPKEGALERVILGGEADVKESEAQELRESNKRLTRRVEELTEQFLGAVEQVKAYERQSPLITIADEVPGRRDVAADLLNGNFETFYAMVRDRLAKEAPAIIRVLTIKPEIELEVTRETVRVDGKTLRGRVVQLLSQGFFDDGCMQAHVRTELERKGAGISDAKNLPRELEALVVMGFLTIEDGKDAKGRDRKLYQAVPDMKVRVVGDK